MTINLEDDPRPPSAKVTTWVQERRLQFIDFRLRWEGHINRTDLTEHFGISIPQASLDFAAYMHMAPGNLEYDRKSKAYVVTEHFTAVFQRSSAKRYLAELIATKTGILEPGVSLLGSMPEMDLVPSPGRLIAEDTVVKVLQAIRERRSLMVRYQSMTSMDESERRVSPHALGFDGFRWHVRAFCHKRNKFIDFVLARILDVGASVESDADPSMDTAWHNILDLVLIPNPDLTPPKKRVIELDYGMQNGEVHLLCREAFLYYTFKRLGLNESSPTDPLAQQIILKNRVEIEQYLKTTTTSTPS